MTISRSQFAKKLFTNADYFETNEYLSFSKNLFSLLLENDFNGEDLTTTLTFSNSELEEVAKTVVIAKSSGVLAGAREVINAFSSVLEFELLVQDGENFNKGDHLMTISGKKINQLKYERIILNVLTYLSSIALFCKKITSRNDGTVLASTRKTLYGSLDKKAAYLGGIATHRINLNDAILVKDTHLDHFNRDFDLLIFEIAKADLSKAKFLEIEVETEAEALEVLEKLPDLFPLPFVIMFDNFSVDQITKTLAFVKKAGLYEKALFEASGGINCTNLADYLSTGVDIISSSTFTKPKEFVDLSLKVLQK